MSMNYACAGVIVCWKTVSWIIRTEQTQWFEEPLFIELQLLLCVPLQCTLWLPLDSD